MKRNHRSFFIIAFLIICLLASAPLWKSANNFNTQHGQVTRIKKTHKKKAKKHVVTWGYPFKRLYEKKIKFKSGQEYGETDVMRRSKPKSYFHDGYDFGFSEVGHSAVLAIHNGTVHRVHYRPGMGLYVWVISKDVTFKFIKKAS